MKKLISILLCAALLLTCVSALAEDKAVIDFQPYPVQRRSARWL